MRRSGLPPPGPDGKRMTPPLYRWRRSPATACPPRAGAALHGTDSPMKVPHRRRAVRPGPSQIKDVSGWHRAWFFPPRCSFRPKTQSGCTSGPSTPARGCWKQPESVHHSTSTGSVTVERCCMNVRQSNPFPTFSPEIYGTSPARGCKAFFSPTRAYSRSKSVAVSSRKAGTRTRK